MPEFAIILLTVILATVGTFVTTRRNLALQYDAELRKDRLRVYSLLWALLEELSTHARQDRRLPIKDAKGLAVKLREWYYQTGGIFLSNETRTDCLALQRALQAAIQAAEKAPESELCDDQYEFVRAHGHRLRSSMTRDVGTRKTFKLRGDQRPRDLPMRATAYQHSSSGKEVRLTFHQRPALPRAPFTLPKRITARVSPVGNELGDLRWDDGLGVFIDPRDGRRFLFDSDNLVEQERLDVAAPAPSPPALWRRVADNHSRPTAE